MTTRVILSEAKDLILPRRIKYQLLHIKAFSTWQWIRVISRRHASVPSGDIRSNSGLALLSRGEEPCPLVLYTGRIVYDPYPLRPFTE